MFEKKRGKGNVDVSHFLFPYRAVTITGNIEDDKIPSTSGGGDEIGRGRAQRRERKDASRVVPLSLVVSVVVIVAENKDLFQSKPLTSAASVPACAHVISSDDRRSLRRRHG